MDYEEFKFRNYELDPTIELEAMELGRTLNVKLDECPSTHKRIADYPGFNAVSIDLDSLYPMSDITLVRRTQAAFYDAIRDVTVVGQTDIADIDGEHRQLWSMRFFKGQPFGGIFETDEVGEFNGQFQERPDYLYDVSGESDEPSLDKSRLPLQDILAVSDISTGAVVRIEVNSFASRTIDDEIQRSDIQSMRIWLDGATEPLPIIDGDIM